MITDVNGIGIAAFAYLIHPNDDCPAVPAGFPACIPATVFDPNFQGDPNVGYSGLRPY